jgi:DNA-directed RNA polymerase subunit E'/Rpb7
MIGTNGTVGEVVEGVIESANDHGIKVAGEWRNVSKFKPVDLPDRGARVRLELDRAGFIKTLQVLDQPAVTDNLSRDRTITRLAVLKAAANFLADKWVTWIDQAPQPSKEAF